jgi:hypothetical protein
MREHLVLRLRILPDGQISRSGGDSIVESFFCLEAKFFSSSRRANQTYNFRRPGPKEGRIMIVSYVGQGCGGRGSVGRARDRRVGFGL